MSPPLLYQWMSWLTPLPCLEPTSDMGKAEDPEYPKWIKVHSSHLVASMGSVPPPWETSGGAAATVAPDRGEHQCHLVEEQQALKGDSSSALPQSSPEPAHHEEEDPGAQPKAPLLGFKEIAKSLTRGGPSEMGIDCPLTVALPDLSVGSTVATLTLTGVCQDQTTGAIYLITVMTSIGLMNLETPYSGWPPGADHRRTDGC